MRKFTCQPLSAGPPAGWRKVTLPLVKSTARAGGEPRPRLLVLAVHPPSVAATRLRALQYQPYVEEAGMELHLWTLFQERDLGRWFGKSQVLRALTLVAALRRVVGAMLQIHRAAVVIVHREALPIGPPLLELYAARRVPVVWDVDDAIWVEFVSPTAGRVPRWLRASGRKFERLSAAATEVWAGSEVLATWAQQHNSRVRVVPTVVRVPASVVPYEARDRMVAWIGTHSTGPFIERVLPLLAELDPAPEVVVVGANLTSIPAGLPVRVLPWSAANEDAVLARALVGLYPVDRSHPLAEGKCGLKAILYMAHGVPPVVTPTTTNAAIVRAYVDGLHAEDDEAWLKATRRLLEDPDLWRRLQQQGRARVEMEYSLQAWGPRVGSFAAALVRRS